jgi:serine protease Do
MNENPNNNYYAQNDTYHYYPQQAPQPAPKKKKKGLALKIIAIVLVCVIIGGFAGYGIRAVVKDLGGLPKLSLSEPYSPDDPAGGEPSRPDLPSGPDQRPGEQGEPAPSPAVQSADPIAPTGRPLTVQTSTGSGVLSGSEIYEKVVHSCVGVVTPITQTNIFGQEVSTPISGSGFIITEDGYILTNYHVVEEANKMNYPIKVATYSGDEYDAVIVGYDEENDVALIKIDATGLSPVTIGSINDTKVGETVYAIGNPLGELTYTFTNGIVSALDREINTESGISINMFQTNVTINSGNSGGPIINSFGEVIGIASAKYSSTGVEGLGFAIPIEDAMKIVDDLMQYGFVRGKPYFGITVRTITSSIAEYYNWVEGAYIMDVDPYSCAAAAGLQTGDIIIRLDETEIKSSSDLIKAKKDYTAGDTVHLTVYRGGEELQMVLTFDEEGARAFLGEGRNG